MTHVQSMPDVRFKDTAGCGRQASMHRHCEVCAGPCRSCEHACAELLDSLG